MWILHVCDIRGRLTLMAQSRCCLLGRRTHTCLCVIFMATNRLESQGCSPFILPSPWTHPAHPSSRFSDMWRLSYAWWCVPTDSRGMAKIRQEKSLGFLQTACLAACLQLPSKRKGLAPCTFHMFERGQKNNANWGETEYPIMYNNNQFLVSHCLISLSVILFCDQSGYIQTDIILIIVTHTVVKKKQKQRKTS